MAASRAKGDDKHRQMVGPILGSGAGVDGEFLDTMKICSFGRHFNINENVCRTAGAIFVGICCVPFSCPPMFIKTCATTGGSYYIVVASPVICHALLALCNSSALEKNEPVAARVTSAFLYDQNTKVTRVFHFPLDRPFVSTDNT